MEERQITNPWGGRGQRREGEKTLSRTRGGCSAGNGGATSAGSGREAEARRVQRGCPPCVGGGGVRKKRRGAGEGRMERGRGEKEGGGRPGIDRLKKGWIFLPLGGGPAALEGRVPDSITTKPTSDLRERNRSTEDLLSLLLFPPPGDSSFSFLLPSPLFSGDDRG